MSSFLGVANWLQHYGLVAMVAVFVLIFVTTYWPSRKSQVERLGRIPLDDDEPIERRSTHYGR
jgi:cbb3-type cytochrome oxidase subunit 3